MWSLKEIEDQIAHSHEVLFHALFCALQAQCNTLEQAEGWYKATKFKFWASGIHNSLIFAIIYDGHHCSINGCLCKSGFQIMFEITIWLIHNSVTNAMSGRDTQLPVSFYLMENFDVLLLLPGEDDLILVLNTACVSMDCFCLLHWCNQLIAKLYRIQWNFVDSFQQVIDQGWLNSMLDQEGCSTVHLISIKVLSKASMSCLLGTSTYLQQVIWIFIREATKLAVARALYAIWYRLDSYATTTLHTVWWWLGLYKMFLVCESSSVYGTIHVVWGIMYPSIPTVTFFMLSDADTYVVATSHSI